MNEDKKDYQKKILSPGTIIVRKSTLDHYGEKLLRQAYGVTKDAEIIVVEDKEDE